MLAGIPALFMWASSLATEGAGMGLRGLCNCVGLFSSSKKKRPIRGSPPPLGSLPHELTFFSPSESSPTPTVQVPQGHNPKPCHSPPLAGEEEGAAASETRRVHGPPRYALPRGGASGRGGSLGLVRRPPLSSASALGWCSPLFLVSLALRTGGVGFRFYCIVSTS